MADGSTAAFAAQALIEAGQLATGAPTAAQITRFQNQLELPRSALESGAARYEAPLLEMVDRNDFRATLDYMAQMNDKFRVELFEPLAPMRARPTGAQAPLDSESLLQTLWEIEHRTRDTAEKIARKSMLQVEFMFMAKQIEMCQRGVQTLYQQQG